MNYYELQVAIATYFAGHAHIGLDDLWPIILIIVGFIIHLIMRPKDDGVEDKR